MGLGPEHSIHVPHELPGQDPEGGSEVNFGDESSSLAETPREGGDISRGASENFSMNFSMEGRGASVDSMPRSPTATLPGAGGGSSSGAGGLVGNGVAPAAPATPGPAAAPLPAAADGVGVGSAGAADAGLGGSWGDLMMLRNQSMAARTNPLHQLTEVRKGCHIAFAFVSSTKHTKWGLPTAQGGDQGRGFGAKRATGCRQDGWDRDWDGWDGDGVGAGTSAVW